MNDEDIEAMNGILDLMHAVKNAVDRPPTLEELQAVPLSAWRGLLNRNHCLQQDHIAAVDQGIVRVSWPDGGTPAKIRTAKGTRYLAALAELANGLGRKSRKCLAVCVTGDVQELSSHVVYDLRHAGLLAPDVDERYFATDLGRAVLLWLERND